ncbi:MAG: HNH endonuclease, partial [Polaromonas sp.]|nr:HNH endonuclease [Polaromonas sp.]
MKLTKTKREFVRLKYGGNCAYCGIPLPDRWHADHREPVVRDWYKPGAPASRPERDHIGNMMPACPPCNIDKHSFSLEGWRQIIQRSNDVLSRDNSTFRR